MNRLFLCVLALGFAGCPPKPEQCTATSCAAGLVCGADGTCQAPVVTGLTVSAAARGCELVFTEPQGVTVSNVTFGEGLRGTWVREAPKVAVTFVTSADAAIAAGAVALGSNGSGITLLRGSCVDLRGARLPGNPVELK